MVKARWVCAAWLDMFRPRAKGATRPSEYRVGVRLVAADEDEVEVEVGLLHLLAATQIQPNWVQSRVPERTYS
jgi:hypothetical protein